jgi:adenylate cyclase
LAAILAADVVGYSALMSQDEEGTHDRIRALHREVIKPAVEQHQGRVVKTTGDGFLIEFASPVEAVRCALAVQKALGDGPLQLRIGMNLGDVIIEPDGDVYGEGVNVAARLEALCGPGSILISGKVHDEVEGKVEAAFESRGEQQVKNIPRPVRVYELEAGQAVGTPPRVAHALPLPNKPSIAVLPFDNLGSERDDDYLADGIVEDIIAALSRVRSFFVIARNSTFTYKGRAVNVQQVSRELGVRYVLEGSVRRVRDRVRVTSQLIDATTGNHLWADHVDGKIEDIFDLQDQITASVVGAIQPSIRAAEVERARRKRPENLDAYDLVMQALPHVWSLDAEANRTATDLLQKALKLDPKYPLALSLAGWCSGQKVVYNWSVDVEADKRDTLQKAQLAAELASDDPFVLTVLGAGLTITHEFQAGLHMIEKALALDPNSAWAWNRLGWLRNYLGEPELAIGHFERAIRLSPFDPMVFNSHVGIGSAHFIVGRYDDAVYWYEKACLASPKAIWIHRALAAAYFYSGRQEHAEASVRKLQATYPHLTATAAAFAHVFEKEVLDRIAEGLRRAGLPDSGT